MTTMLSFRVDDDLAAQLDRWMRRLGVERSELLRDALASHLARLASASESEAYARHPFTDEEVALDDAGDWGPAEDWQDWRAWVEERDRAAR